MILFTAGKTMIDSFNRNIDYLRISVTDRCNLRCVYCMPECGIKNLAHSDILTFEEIIRICGLMADMGLKKIKLTGGEPLVRKDLHVLLRRLKAIKGIECVTLTTNGVLLKEQWPALLDAGLDGINISLDTTDAACFQKITRCDQFVRVWEGIQTVLKAGKIPVKINCVPLIEDKENILTMAALAKDYPLHVRFIEMMPIGLGKNCTSLTENDILLLLQTHFGQPVPVKQTLGNGPCHYYHLEGFLGHIGFISALSHKFCDQCNRIRLCADGFLKTCLQYEQGVPLRDDLRRGLSDRQLQQMIARAVLQKPRCHQFEDAALAQAQQTMMSQIGG